MASRGGSRLTDSGLRADSKVFQALVVAVAGVNHVLEYPRMLIPG